MCALSISVTWTLVAELGDRPRRRLEATKASIEDHDTRRHVQPGCGTMRM
jgi:hypothetical protein